MSQVQQIKDATNIVEVIGERLDLQRAGGYHKACCPFHSEKSPSFFVSDSMQRFKCFGCGESGDVITFLQRYDGMTFLEALETLADKAGIELQKFTQSAAGSAADDERKKIIEVLSLSSEYYHYLLTEHTTGKVAREYMKDRGINHASVQLFHLGYSSSEWDSLFTYLHKKKRYSPDLLEKAGLVIKGKRGGYYDRFRNRLMFPLRNHRGQVVGFSGRVLDPKIKEAKYINSPETVVYHKSAMLFGYAELFQHIRKQKTVVVVEGELDVISSTQAHVNEVVAVKGSALTEEHAKLIKRAADRVVLSLDTDSAGIKATKRAIAVLAPQGLEVRVAQMPSGKDPDDLIKQDPKLWRRAVKNTLSVYAFLIEQAISTHGVDSGESKRKILEEVGLVLAQMTHAVEQDFYIKLLSEKIHVREDLVREDIRTFSRIGKERYTQLQEVAHRQSANNLRTSSSSLDIASGATSQKNTRKIRLERYISFLFFQLFIPPYTRLQEKMLAEVLKSLAFLLNLKWDDTVTEKILTTCISFARRQMNAEKQIVLESLTGTLAEDQADIVMQITYQPKALEQLERSEYEQEWNAVLAQLKQLSVQAKIHKVTELLKVFDAKDELTRQEEKKQQALLQEVMDLKKRA